MLPPRPVGRPTSLTPELGRRICEIIASTKASIEDAAGAVGVGRSTVQRWLAQGRQQTEGLFRDFLDDIEVARSRGTVVALGQLAKAGQDPKFWQATARRLEMTDRRYARQFKITVEDELEAFLERLRGRISADLFAQVVAAADGEGDLPVGGEAQGGAGNADDRDVGEAVQPTPAAPETADVPRT